MAWEENSCISLNMQLIAILSRIGVEYCFVSHYEQLILAFVFQVGRCKSTKETLCVFALMSNMPNMGCFQSSSTFVENNVFIVWIVKQLFVFGPMCFYFLLVRLV